uniref:RH59222p n=1 Tax=Drosophila melanogaster TaxID=7227 RepID=Q8IGC2_DROME|nr:RH59222p [Drosophila melanogaster]
MGPCYLFFSCTNSRLCGSCARSKKYPYQQLSPYGHTKAREFKLVFRLLSDLFIKNKQQVLLGFQVYWLICLNNRYTNDLLGNRNKTI